jgi:Domain of unknown function (DUF4430)
VKKLVVITVIALLMIAAGAIAGGAVKFGGDTGSGASGVDVLVSRDFGTKVIQRKSAGKVPSGETVMRYLQRHFDVKTRYGGGFVQSIEGLSGSSSGSTREDWFYYVNGIEAEEGSASRKLAAGDQVWWDHHDWAATQTVPAVVGSWPEPFKSGEEGRQIPLAVVCAGEERACDEVRARLGDEGVKRVSTAGIGAGVGQKLLRIVVGPWSAIKRDPAVSRLAKGPGASGVYAKPTDAGIELLDESGKVSRTLTGGGLIAATRFQDQQPTWIVTGSDDAGVAAAAASLREDVLRNRFAVAIDQGRGVALPVIPVP